MMMRSLDHTDGIDLDIAKMLNGCQHGRFSRSKWRGFLSQSLRTKGNCPGFRKRQGYEIRKSCRSANRFLRAGLCQIHFDSCFVASILTLYLKRPVMRADAAY